MATTLTPSQARTAVVGMRFTLAAAVGLMPRVSGRLFGISADENPAAPYLARLYAVRNLLMGLDMLRAGSGRELEAVAQRHAAVDAVDAAASLLGGSRGYLSPRAAWMTGSVALVAVGLGLRAGDAVPPTT
jgi:hypothetical protein